MKELTTQQAAFVEHYTLHGNARASARAAGYGDSPGVSYGLMRDPKIKAAIDEHRRGAAERAGLNADMLLQQITAVINLDLAKLYDADGRMLRPHEMDEDTRKAVAGIEPTKFGTKVKLYDKLGAIGMAMKHLGLLVDRVEHSGEVQVVGMAQRIRERAAKAAPDPLASEFA